MAFGGAAAAAGRLLGGPGLGVYGHSGVALRSFFAAPWPAAAMSSLCFSNAGFFGPAQQSRGFSSSPAFQRHSGAFATGPMSGVARLPANALAPLRSAVSVGWRRGVSRAASGGEGF